MRPHSWLSWMKGLSAHSLGVPPSQCHFPLHPFPPRSAEPPSWRGSRCLTSAGGPGPNPCLPFPSCVAALHLPELSFLFCRRGTAVAPAAQAIVGIATCAVPGRGPLARSHGAWHLTSPPLMAAVITNTSSPVLCGLCPEPLHPQCQGGGSPRILQCLLTSLLDGVLPGGAQTL